MGFTKDALQMDLHKMIADLRQERQRIDEAIEAVKRLSAGKLRRRGRPPAWLTDEMREKLSGSEGSDPLPNPHKDKK